MSNTIINWRFWAWHFQVVRWGDWRAYIADGRSPVWLSRNNWHAPGGPGRERGTWRPIALYEGGWYLVPLAALVVLAAWAIVR